MIELDFTKDMAVTIAAVIAVIVAAHSALIVFLRPPR